MSVHIEKEGFITTILLDRPDVRNAVDGPTARELAAAFRAFNDDDQARVAVLAGLGGTFCSGADLKAIAEHRGQANHLSREGDGPMGPTRLKLDKPVIAAIDGYAVAGGLELALWCDLRVVEQDAVMGVFCRRWGVPLIDGGTVRLPRLIGLSHAMDLILTGRPVAAEEAFRMGLANRIVAHGTARASAEQLAREIAHHPQVCLRHDRFSALEQHGLSLNDALANEFEHGLKVMNSGETLQGSQRFADGHGRHGHFASPDSSPSQLEKD